MRSAALSNAQFNHRPMNVIPVVNVIPERNGCRTSSGDRQDTAPIARIPVSPLATALLLFIWITAVAVSGAQAKEQIVFWTTEMETERLEIQKAIARRFTAEYKIHVAVIPVHEDRLSEAVVEAEKADALPDVVYHPIQFSAGWADSGVLDVRAATDVINGLDKKTFGKGVLASVGYAKGFAAIPIDAWHMLLLYRIDLFKQKGLPAPDTWDRILAAANALHNPPMRWGMVVPTDPDQLYTQQVFEHFALSNGVFLNKGKHQVTLDTPEMLQTLAFYQQMARYTPGGNISWSQTRAEYLSGRAAMTVWSPFILDELSGLRSDLQIIPDLTAGRTGYLAENTGFVSLLHGINAVAGQYSQINCLGIFHSARKRPAKQWSRYLLGDGYLQWLDMAPEGKLPVRKGTRLHPGCFIDGWMQLHFGANLQTRLSEYYGPEVLKAIVSNETNGPSHWGSGGNRSALVSKIHETKVILKILKELLDGKFDAEMAARKIHSHVNALK